MAWAVWADAWTVVTMGLALATAGWFAAAVVLAGVRALAVRRSPFAQRVPWYYAAPHPDEARQVVRRLSQRQPGLRPLGAS
jgi:hypothetical protein